MEHHERILKQMNKKRSKPLTEVEKSFLRERFELGDRANNRDYIYGADEGEGERGEREDD